MKPPIRYRHTAYSPMPRGHLGRWRWEIRDDHDGPILADGRTLTHRGAMRQRERARARCQRVPVIRHRMAPTRTFTAAEREQGLALINACMTTFAAGMRAADDATLRHEAERLESLPKSPVIRSMRAIVDGELAARTVNTR